MTIATYIQPGGLFIQHGGGYLVERDGKTIAHIRPSGESKWRVYMIGRNGVSNQYDSPQKAAQAYGLKVDKWKNDSPVHA